MKINIVTTAVFYRECFKMLCVFSNVYLYDTYFQGGFVRDYIISTCAESVYLRFNAFQELLQYFRL